MNEKDLFLKMVLDSWNGQVKAINSLLGKLTDEQLEKEIASGRNRGIYILGHLTAVYDLMLPLLRFEDSIFPELQPIYVDSPDKMIAITPSATQLRAQWQTVNERLGAHLGNLAFDEWFTRHANISEENFIVEPNRNRLNAFFGRTIHLGYHRGQLTLLLPKT